MTLMEDNLTAIVEYPYQAPGLCFICEQNPEGVWLDTHRTFEPGGLTHLTGRKYVCEHCAGEFAASLGFLSPKDTEALRTKLFNMEADLVQAQTKLSVYSEYQRAVDQIKEFDVQPAASVRVTTTPAKPRGRPRKAVAN